MRRFNQHYGSDLNNYFDEEKLQLMNGAENGIDQLHTLLFSLLNNPDDRRMLINYWNPCQLHMMALPPCAFTWGVVHIDGVLNLWWTQRSIDVGVGLFSNIASFAALLLLLCKFANMRPGNLTGYLCDTHIYEDHLEGIQLLLSREKRGWPTLKITCDQPFDLKDNSLEVNWTHKDVLLENYNPHPPIKFEVAV